MIFQFVILALALVVVATADEDLKTDESVYLRYGLPLPYAYNYYNGLDSRFLLPSVRYVAPATTTFVRYATPLSVPTRVLGTDLLGRTVDIEGREILLAKK